MAMTMTEISPMAVEETYYQKLRVLNRLIVGTPKNFRWLIKPADRMLFTKGDFPGRYYDNGLLKLRENIPPGSVFTAGNRLHTGITHVDLMQRFITQIQENCLFREQTILADSGEEIQLVDPDGSLAAVLDPFVCPVCMDPCFPPAYVCPNSHTLCGRCRNTLMKAVPQGGTGLCPTCRTQTNFEHPFYINGAIVGVFDFKCRYAVYGCQVTPNGHDILDHIDNGCPFRPWRCYYCPTIVKTPDFAEHLLSSHLHEIPLILKEPSLPAVFSFEVPIAVYNERYRVRNELIKLGCMCIKDEGFFFVLEMELLYGCYGWAVGYLGPNTSCKRFVADIAVRTEYDIGGGRPTEFVTDAFYNQPIISCQEDMRAILDKIKTADYQGGFAMRDFSRFGGAGRYHATMELRLRHAGPLNVTTTDATLAISQQAGSIVG